jgi:methylglutaconyl-CoA hydratase
MAMSDPNIVLSAVDGRGVATVTLNRPDIHNAFDDILITDLTACFNELSENPEVRIVILTGAGKSFSAGADLNWMRRMADYSDKENFEDARKVADLLAAIAFCDKPVIAKVQGTAMGGGVGLVAACDIAIGSIAAKFALSEVKLGVIPATIGPYVIRAIGERQAGRYMVTGERFDAIEAARIGLLHTAVEPDQLDRAVNSMVDGMLANSPNAMTESKALIAAIVNRPIDDDLKNDTADRIARVRASDEGKEGLNAFLNKRAPSWLGKE